MIIEVGKPLNPGQTRYSEGLGFEYYPDGPILLIAFNKPTEKEISGVKTADWKWDFMKLRRLFFSLSAFKAAAAVYPPLSAFLSVDAEKAVFHLDKFCGKMGWLIF